MSGFWMVRAGEGGYLADEFVEKSCVAVGFDGVGDFTGLTTPDLFKAAVRSTYPGHSSNQIASAAGVGHRFRTVIRRDDHVLTYSPASRLYHFGKVIGDYEFLPGYVTDYAHMRRVKWVSHIARDALSTESRNSLGSTLTLFEPGESVRKEIERLAEGKSTLTPTPARDVEERNDVERIYSDQLSRSHEFIKDRINQLDPRAMEQLAASLLRALGLRARVTSVGPDRGRDVIASPDGLGLQSPRVICEVKHRKGQIGAPDVRSFVAGLRGDDRGLFLSTGGFSKEAKYEADRAAIPVTLLDLDELARLVVEHYERFDDQGRALLPLDRIYWPKP